MITRWPSVELVIPELSFLRNSPLYAVPRVVSMMQEIENLVPSTGNAYPFGSISIVVEPGEKINN